MSHLIRDIAAAHENSSLCRIDERITTMTEKKIDKLYELLERAEKERDTEAATALRWAIFHLENQ